MITPHSSWRSRGLTRAAGAVLAIAACSTGHNPAGPPDAASDVPGSDTAVLDTTVVDTTVIDTAVLDTAMLDAPTVETTPPAPGTFCALPGSIVYTAGGPQIVNGPDAGIPRTLRFLHLPVGFCAHHFARVPVTRQLRFAPDGHLFAASPSTFTDGGGSNGLGEIVVLPDDNHDGYADSSITYMGPLASVQGLMFAGGYFYFQNGATIERAPFQNGDLAPSGTVQTVATITLPQDSLHWPKVMDVAQDGTIYVTNGGSQADACLSSRPVRGAIVELGSNGATPVVATGFRNPIALRCSSTHDVCLALDLSLDLSAAEGGREKLVSIRQGDDWGYPCCATLDTPYSGVTYMDTAATPDCSQVQAESVSFFIGNTPFGLDFETGVWPAPWGNRVFVTLHGHSGTWFGARVVSVALDPTTGLPESAGDLDGGDSANMSDFATGWDDGSLMHGRPAAITFASDGRMFIGDDRLGEIFWVAPLGLMAQ